jgi:hypothetical protein
VFDGANFTTPAVVAVILPLAGIDSKVGWVNVSGIRSCREVFVVVVVVVVVLAVSYRAAIL